VSWGSLDLQSTIDSLFMPQVPRSRTTEAQIQVGQGSSTERFGQGGGNHSRRECFRVVRHMYVIEITYTLLQIFRRWIPLEETHLPEIALWTKRTKRNRGLQPTTCRMSSPRTEPLAEAPRDPSNDRVDPKELQELRRNWKWAAVCDFLWTFNTAMRLDLLNYYVRSFSLFHSVCAPYIALRLSMPPATSGRWPHS